MQTVMPSFKWLFGNRASRNNGSVPSTTSPNSTSSSPTASRASLSRGHPIPQTHSLHSLVIPSTIASAVGMAATERSSSASPAPPTAPSTQNLPSSSLPRAPQTGGWDDSYESTPMPPRMSATDVDDLVDQLDHATSPTVAARSKMSHSIQMIKHGFLLLAKNAEPLLEGTPFKIPFSILNVCLELMNTVSANNTALQRLLEQTSNRLELVNAALIGAMSENATSLDALSRRGALEKAVLNEEDGQAISESVARIHGYLTDFEVEVLLSIERSMDQTMRQLNAIYLQGWPRSMHATYGADTESSTTLLKREACTANTRVSMRQQIQRWVQDPSPVAARIYWLSGPAGCGKSTIAFSTSDYYDGISDFKLLAASFFCSRQFEDTRARKYIIPSIVYQLAHHSTSFRRALINTQHFGSFDEPDKQMKALLVEPWKECIRLRQFKIPSFLIVIDALDEIVDGGGAVFLRQLLHVVEAGHLAGLRFLVTSRPHRSIADLFRASSPDVCRLQEVGMADAVGDVYTFLQAKLPALVDTAELRQLSPSILWSAFSGLEEEEFSVRLRILHAILAIPSPLQVRTIARLDPLFTQELVELVVEELNAVLFVKTDERIFWYHTSFLDFIFDSRRSKFTAEEGRMVDMSCGDHVRLEFAQRMSFPHSWSSKAQEDLNYTRIDPPQKALFSVMRNLAATILFIVLVAESL
ncbi:hypothetical protein B0H14DRAFT_3124270 [Mycena olivaceomarginata]|nr:hypothetical protein B0H14DRAFT_3124270 [Mycena olivaceomarginata]